MVSDQHLVHVGYCIWYPLYATPIFGVSIPAASSIPSFVSVGPWECHPRRPSDPTSTETTVRFERQCSSHFLELEGMNTSQY
jgi:hypothetical protein